MSLIQVRKKGAAPSEGFVAKYHIPQTGAALLEALALRVGTGDLEDAHGVSVTKADTHVAAGDYVFTPGRCLTTSTAAYEPAKLCRC